MVLRLLAVIALTCGVSMASPQMSMGQPQGQPRPQVINIPQFNASAQGQQCEPSSHTTVHEVCSRACDCLCAGTLGSLWLTLCYSPCVELIVSNRAVCFVANTVGHPSLNPFSNCRLGVSGAEICSKSCACCGTLSQDCVNSCQHGLISFLTFHQCQRVNQLITGQK